MPLLFQKSARAFFVFLCCISAPPVMASHLVGDEFFYSYLGDTTISGSIMHKYQVTLNLYADCLTGEPSAIAQDNPAYFAVYDATGMLFSSDSIEYTSSVSIPGSLSGACGTGIITTAVCLIKKTFVKEYYLPSGTTPYTVEYQRCCKNASLTNVSDPANSGSTYYCTIPPTSLVASNNCAMFKYYPPAELALDEPFSFDNSATDADGDSLSYELCNTNDFSGSSTNLKPFPPLPPPFIPVGYVYPLSWSNPMYCSLPLAIDPVTGLLTGTPDITGRYLIGLCCHEWRGGVMINTSQREFEFVVVAATGGSYHPVAGPDTTIYVGDSVHFYASDASGYSWSPGTFLSSTSIPNPAGYFPAAGTFHYIMTGVSDSGCTGTTPVTVTVLEYSEYTAPNAFTPNNDDLNDYFYPIPILNATLLGFKVYNRIGQLLYNGNGSGAAWDGTYHGVQQDMGVYYYVITYIDNAGNTRTKTGNVTLIR